TVQRRQGDDRGLASALGNLGVVALSQGDYAGARTLYEQSLAFFDRLEDKPGQANALLNLGNVAADQGDHAGAQALYEQSLALFRELGDKQGVAYALQAFAALAAARGYPARAVQLLGAVETMRAGMGAPLPPLEQETIARLLEEARSTLDAEV